MSSTTSNGKRGGNLVGKPHNDKKGNSVGGIKAVVTDNNGQPVELEGGEVIINKAASKKHWKELSKINQSAGNGVPIGPPVDPHEADPDEYKQGGKIEFNPNKIPNKWILKYAEDIKENHPEVWKMGGNIFGNQAFKNLKRVSDRGYWLDSERWMMIKWRSFVARHKKDFRIAGVVAMLKWVDKVEKGWPYMKSLIEAEIKKKEGKSSSEKMKKGGVVSYKDKYNKKYGFEKSQSHSLSDIAKTTGISKSGIQGIYNKGIGAYKTNPGSVRPNVKSKEQWAYARVYSAVMGGKAADVDAKELKMDKGGQFKTIKRKDGSEYDVKIYSEQELEIRAEKKKGNLHNIANQMSRLRSNLNKDLNSDSEKTALTALSILVMLETSERVGNETSAENGHVGITGLTKEQVKITGTNTKLTYTGKSGVDHDKTVSSEKIANALKKAKSNSPGKFIFETSDGFKVKNDTVNRYLSKYDVTAKDIRGFSANKWISTKLKQIKPGETETVRKKQFREIVKTVADKVGHGAATLKKHYLLPDLESTFIEKSKVLDLKEVKMEKGGMSQSRKNKFDLVMDEFKDGDLRSGSKTGPIVKNPKQAVAIAYSESKNMQLGGFIAGLKANVHIGYKELHQEFIENLALKKLQKDSFSSAKLPFDVPFQYEQRDSLLYKNPSAAYLGPQGFEKQLADTIKREPISGRVVLAAMLSASYITYKIPNDSSTYFSQVLFAMISKIAGNKSYVNIYISRSRTRNERFKSLYSNLTNQIAEIKGYINPIKGQSDFNLADIIFDESEPGNTKIRYRPDFDYNNPLEYYSLQGSCTDLQLAKFLVGKPLTLKGDSDKEKTVVQLIPTNSSKTKNIAQINKKAVSNFMPSTGDDLLSSLKAEIKEKNAVLQFKEKIDISQGGLSFLSPFLPNEDIEIKADAKTKTKDGFAIKFKLDQNIKYPLTKAADYMAVGNIFMDQLDSNLLLKKIMLRDTEAFNLKFGNQVAEIFDVKVKLNFGESKSAVIRKEAKEKQKKSKPEKVEPFPELKKPKYDAKLDYLELYKKSLPGDASLETDKYIAFNIQRKYKELLK